MPKEVWFASGTLGLTTVVEPLPARAFSKTIVKGTSLLSSQFPNCGTCLGRYCCKCRNRGYRLLRSRKTFMYVNKRKDVSISNINKKMHKYIKVPKKIQID
jgi:hypothetical protein